MELVYKIIRGVNPEIFSLKRVSDIRIIDVLGNNLIRFRLKLSDGKKIRDVLLTFDSFYNYGKVLNEYNSLKILRKAGIKNIPEILFFNKSKKWMGSFLLTNFIPGGPEFNLNDSPGKIKNVAELLGRIHMIKSKNPTKPGFIKDKILGYDLYDVLNMYFIIILKKYTDFIRTRKYLKRFRDIPFSDTDLSDPKKMIHEFKNSMEENKGILKNNRDFSFIHADPSIGNFIFKKDWPFLIDFKHTCFGDRAFDIASLSHHHRFSGKGKIIFFNEYLKKLKDESIKKRVYLYSYYFKISELIKFDFNRY